MGKGQIGTRVDWAAIGTFIASAGILVVGLLLNSLELSSAVKAAAIVLALALIAGLSAGFGAWRGSSRISGQIRDETSRQLLELTSGFNLCASKIEEDLQSSTNQLQSDLDGQIKKSADDSVQSFRQFQNQIVPSLQKLEHTVLDYLIAHPAAIGQKPRQVTQIGVVEVTALEDHASEVWIYGVELKWDAPDSPFSNIMERNLQERVHYRYLVPETNDALAAVSAIQRRLHRIRDLDALLAFRVRQERYPLGLLGFSLYNPTYEKGKDEIDRLRAVTYMVQFPRATGPDPDNGFVRLSGNIVREHEAAFYQVWQSSKPYKAME